jgi:hypothetical protein
MTLFGFNPLCPFGSEAEMGGIGLHSSMTVRLNMSETFYDKINVGAGKVLRRWSVLQWGGAAVEITR